MMTTTQNTNELASITDLVRGAQLGDRDAFGQLVERYEHAVFGAAISRLGNYAEAEELCQDVFIQALQKLHQLKDPVCFGGWLRSITHRMAINRMVRRRSDVATEPNVIASACVERRTPLSCLLDSERQSQVRDGLDRLRSLDRDTLMAFYVRGRSLLEMSDEFEAPVGTIKRRLHVARKRLAKEVAELVAV